MKSVISAKEKKKKKKQVIEEKILNLNALQKNCFYESHVWHIRGKREKPHDERIENSSIHAYPLIHCTVGVLAIIN